MITINKIEEVKTYLKKEKHREKKIGFIPTMGYLHEGHLSLVRAAKKECDITVMSVFVNKAQFSPNEDFEKYPKDQVRDSELANAAGVDILFIPTEEEIYPGGYSTYISVEGGLADVLCGGSRPGHYKGVCTIVAKLFNIIGPDISYFGQKDYQQALILRKMVEDLNMCTRIRIMPIIRDEDGLALSSRNSYLSSDDRKKALNLNRTLITGKESLLESKLSVGEVKDNIVSMLDPCGGVSVDYVEILDADNLDGVSENTHRILIALAVFVGGTRLIDNIIFDAMPCNAEDRRTIKQKGET